MKAIKMSLFWVLLSFLLLFSYVSAFSSHDYLIKETQVKIINVVLAVISGILAMLIIGIIVTRKIHYQTRTGKFVSIAEILMSWRLIVIAIVFLSVHSIYGMLESLGIIEVPLFYIVSETVFMLILATGLYMHYRVMKHTAALEYGKE